ncbi:hypothetical protein PMAYCL1PPCAC_17127, partial [Pristionchus mayeri]
VCAGSTDSANLGLDVCRACTVFYRRSRNRKYVCRSGSGKCSVRDGTNCRKCRLTELEKKLEGKPIGELLTTSDMAVACNNGSVCNGQSTKSSRPLAGLSEITRPITLNGSRPMLQRLQQAYRSMCESRLAGELSRRVPPPHPLDIIEGKYEILPGTFRSIDVANHTFLTALLQFGSSAFPGFDEISRDDKWTIVTNFFGRFRAFEAGYRAEQAFHEDLERTFAGFTLYFDGNMPANFFEGCTVTDEAEAKRIMEDKFKGDFRTGRTHLRSASLRHDEFLSLLALMYWTTDGLSISEVAAQLGKRCRDSVLRELHSYFRDELQMDDYAARLGELLMLLQIFEQRSACASEHFEVLRLLNVFGEESFSYRVTREVKD